MNLLNQLSFYFLLSISISSYAQNLPSLLTERDMNATFSIIGYDEAAKEWGIAVATNNIYVGNSTIYIEPGVGALSVIAETEPTYGIVGLQKLKEGKTIEAAINEVKEKDENRNYRQVSGIDSQGNTFTFTGQSLQYWQGKASAISGNNYVVMGNQLADGVLKAMSSSFETSKGTLAQRLLASLRAGQEAGGQISGKQSAAVMVKGLDNEWFNQIDLRVDNSKEPIRELEILMDYHYGRIRLNQALFALRSGNTERATQKLQEAEKMLEGWTGMYARIALVNEKLNQRDAAIKWIQKGLSESPSWSVYLPAFYFMKDHPEMIPLIQTATFTTTDWESAISMLSNLEQEQQIITLSKELFKNKIESSYLYFLVGRSYYFEKEQTLALSHLKKALDLDPNNVEAQNLVAKMKNN